MQGFITENLENPQDSIAFLGEEEETRIEYCKSKLQRVCVSVCPCVYVGLVIVNPMHHLIGLNVCLVRHYIWFLHGVNI